MHRRQTQNLTPLLVPQLLPHDAIHARPNGLPALVNQHTSIIIKPDHTAVRPLVLLRRAHDDGVPNVAAADFVGGADGDGAARFGAEVALFLDNDDDAIAWEWGGWVRWVVWGRGSVDGAVRYQFWRDVSF